MHDVIYHCYLLEVHDSSGMDERSSDLHLLAHENEELILCITYICGKKICATAYLPCTGWNVNIVSLLGGNIAGHRMLLKQILLVTTNRRCIPVC